MASKKTPLYEEHKKNDGKFIEFAGYSVSDGWPPSFAPEPAANIFLIAFALMIIAGTWLNLSKK